MEDSRQTILHSWLQRNLAPVDFTVSKLAGDASFRRYFRVQQAEKTFVVMDAPPEKEDCRPFIAIAKALAKQGIKVPDVLAADLELGFLLLTDLGDSLYLAELNATSANHLYEQALAVVPRMQACTKVKDWTLEQFGQEIIVRELQLFPDWFLTKHLQLADSQAITTLLNKTFTHLIAVANQQPQVFTHRDYHSRNLLCLPQAEVGVLDFQDAVWGPIVYDAVSLLRDCYIVWPSAEVLRWTTRAYEHCLDEGLLKNPSKDQFLFWFDLVGVQRHLKVLGIFARLFHRDGKTGYLQDLPRIAQYIMDVSSNHSELKDLHDFFQTEIAYKIPEANAKHLGSS